MKHRIRGAGLLVRDDKILLVLERNLRTGKGFWVPPGGGLEAEDGSVVSCVRREFLEETGLLVEVGSLAYVREFVGITDGTHHLELYFRVHQTRGQMHKLDRSSAPSGSELTRHAQWFTQGELQDLDVAPEELRGSFWKEHPAGVTRTRYLGVKIEETGSL